MLEKYLPMIGLLGLSALLLGNALISSPKEAARINALTFSNTAAWEAEHLEMTARSTRYPAEIFANISLPPPPGNSSAVVKRELATLHRYERERTPEMVRDIVIEIPARKVYIGDYSIELFSNRMRFPATYNLLADAMYDLQTIEMQQKKQFDRVRPSALDSSLTPALPVPGHPAYPSYHTTELYFFALVLGELAPERREAFLNRALEIGVNREIAGVHYPSDTAAGKLLAEQFFAALMKNEKFTALLSAAKREWATHPDLAKAQATR